MHQRYSKFLQGSRAKHAIEKGGGGGGGGRNSVTHTEPPVSTTEVIEHMYRSFIFSLMKQSIMKEMIHGFFNSQVRWYSMKVYSSYGKYTMCEV